jgi:hypothetical protein
LITSLVDAGGKFTAGVNNTGGHIFPYMYIDLCDTCKLLSLNCYSTVSKQNMKKPSVQTFSHVQLVQLTPMVHLELRILPQSLKKKNQNCEKGHSWVWGKMIHENKQKSKISCHFPFKNNLLM